MTTEPVKKIYVLMFWYNK